MNAGSSIAVHDFGICCRIGKEQCYGGLLRRQQTMGIHSQLFQAINCRNGGSSGGPKYDSEGRDMLEVGTCYELQYSVLTRQCVIIREIFGHS